MAGPWEKYQTGKADGPWAKYRTQKPAVEAPTSHPDKPQVPNAMGLGMGQGLTLGFGDEIYAAGTAPIRAIGGLFTGDGYDLGRAYDEGLKSIREVHGIAQEQDPVGFGVGEVAGNLSVGGVAAKGGLTLMNAAKPTVASMAPRAAAEGAIYGGLSGAGNAEGGLDDRAGGAIAGAVTGGALGGIVGAGTGALASRAAAKAVPSVDALKGQAGALYDAADASGVIFPTTTVRQVANDIAAKAISEGIDPTLHPRATAALKRLQDAATSGMTVRDAQTMRRILSAAGKDPMNPDEARIATTMRDMFDDVIEKGAPELGEARTLYRQAKKGEILEEAIQKARDAAGANYNASGFENALRQQFKNLLGSKRALRGFSEAEVAAIRKVAHGGPVGNVLRWLGRFSMGSPFSAGVTALGPATLGTLLSGGNPVVGGALGLGAMGLGQAARAGATAATSRNAAVAAALARSGGRMQPRLSAPNRAVMQALIAGGGAQVGGLQPLPVATGR